MIPRKIDIQAGRTRQIDFAVIYDSPDWTVTGKRGTNVMAAEVTAAKFLLKERLSLADADADVTKAIGSGVTMTDGKASVLLAPDDTADLQGTYYATLTLTLTGGVVVDWLDSDFDDVPYVQVDITQGAVEATS